jgi:hypothetical protein
MAQHRKRLHLGFVVVVALAVAVAPLASASPRSGTLTVYKECSEYTGFSGSFCTIKSSSLDEIKAGSKVTYLQPKSLASDVILDPPGPGDDKAYGRCSLNKAATERASSRVERERSTGFTPTSVSHTSAIQPRAPSTTGMGGTASVLSDLTPTLRPEGILRFARS